MKTLRISLTLVTFAFALTLSAAADTTCPSASPADGVAVQDGKFVLKAPGRSLPQRWQIVPDSAAEPQKLYRLQAKSRPNITVTRTRATVDTDGVVDGVTEQRVRRAFFPLFRRARFVPVE
jgi:hypothetical protein